MSVSHSADTQTAAETIVDVTANTADWRITDDVLWESNSDWTWLYYSSRGREAGRVDW